MAEALARGRTSFRARRWTDAHAELTAADRASSIGIDDLELLAVACTLVGRDEDAAEVWSRAHHVCLDSGDDTRGARWRRARSAITTRRSWN